METQPEIINSSVPQTSVIPENPPLPTPVQQLDTDKTSPVGIIVLITLFIISLSAIGFLYWQNQQLKKTIVDLTLNQSKSFTIIKPTIAPTGKSDIKTDTLTSDNQQTVNDDKFKMSIGGGNVYLDKKILEGLIHGPLLEVSDYVLSPDKNHIAVRADTLYLYITDHTGKNISYVGFAEDYEWSPNSNYLAFTSGATEIGPYRLNIYNIKSNKTSELDNQLAKSLTFSKIKWESDSKLISADYSTFKAPGDTTTPFVSGRKTFALNQFK